MWNKKRNSVECLGFSLPYNKSGWGLRQSSSKNNSKKVINVAFTLYSIPSVIKNV